MNPRTECTLAQITHSEEHGIFKFEIIDLRQHATSAQELSHAKGVPLGLSACPRRGLGAFYGGWGGTVPCGTCDGGRARVRGCLHCAAATSASQQAAAPRKTQSDARRLSTVMPPRAQGQAFRPCTASELVRGSWTGDRYTVRGEHADGRAHGGAQPRAPARCSFEPFSATEALDCLRGTDVVVTGNSVARGLHLELADLLGVQPRMATREEEKRRCPLGFGSMFRDNPQLFDHPKCTVQVPVANASLHFVWQTSFTSREISQFYRRLFSDQARSRRRLLLTTMALPNACAAWNGGAVGRNLSWAPDRVMPCLLKLLAQWPSHRDALAEAIAKLPAPSTWVVRTHPAIRTALPRITYQSELSDELAHLQRNVVDAAVLVHPPPAEIRAVHLLDFFRATQQQAASPWYEDAIHPGRVVQRWQAQMILHLHCRFSPGP